LTFFFFCNGWRDAGGGWTERMSVNMPIHSCYILVRVKPACDCDSCFSCPVCIPSVLPMIQ
jgi:hypothetical protein